MTKGRILVVDDDPSLRRVLQVQLEQEGYEVAVAASAQQTLSVLQLRPFDLLITDLKMPGMSGLELLKQARSQYPQTIIIMLTAFGTVDTAVEAMKAGAYDYLTKPVHPDQMSVVVRRALEHVHLVEQVRTLRISLNQKYGFENILGHSDVLLEVLDQAVRAAHSSAPCDPVPTTRQRSPGAAPLRRMAASATVRGSVQTTSSSAHSRGTGQAKGAGTATSVASVPGAVNPTMTRSGHMDVRPDRQDGHRRHG